MRGWRSTSTENSWVDLRELGLGLGCEPTIEFDRARVRAEFRVRLCERASQRGAYALTLPLTVTLTSTEKSFAERCRRTSSGRVRCDATTWD